MIELAEAWELIFKIINPLGTEERPIEKAVDYILAQDVVSPIDVTPFRNSAMDGFAVKTEWLDQCSIENPQRIPVGATSFAGDSISENIPDMQVMKVMTGARVPDIFDAVVPFEDTEYNESEVRFSKPAEFGQHLRQPGEDIIRGQKLFSAGRKLGRLDIGILASIGLPSVSVYRKPSLMIIGTGNELVSPGEKLTGSRIYDSNSFTIYSLVEPFCSKVEKMNRVPDNKDELGKALDLPHDIIVTSGGVSVGERDFVVDLAEACGWKRIFHKVRIKPGKPLYFARRARQFLFGLPGNSLSATVTCSVFLIPALKKLSGWSDYRLNPEPVRMIPDEIRKCGRKLIWPGFISRENGQRVARFSTKRSSAALTALMGTDGLIFQDATDGGSDNVSVAALTWDCILGP